MPGVTVDDEGVCSTCAEFEQVQQRTTEWFRSAADLDAERQRARAATDGSFDCLHLLSGGKDSTYALYQLVDRGWRVHALTLDNGFISEGAKANIKSNVEGEFTHTVAEGDGPVNALDGALRAALATHFKKIKKLKLTDYKVRILDSASGTEAKTRVLKRRKKKRSAI